MDPAILDPRPTKELHADLVLLHAPSVFDFRERDDVVFAYLSDSDSVNVTSIYEMYPLGFLSIKAFLEQRGYAVEIVNLASLMLKYPGLDVDRLLARLHAPVFGLDLHWLAHCQGSIEVARRIKAVHPEALTVFGGLSATYFATELADLQGVDFVIVGYDTLEPLARFMARVRGQAFEIDTIPNLVYRDDSGRVVETGFTHKPVRDYSRAAVDWSFYRSSLSDLRSSRLILTLPNSGCAMDCPLCGGSRFAYRTMMDSDRGIVYKDQNLLSEELRSLGPMAHVTSLYALQCYSEPRDRLEFLLDTIEEVGVKSASFEQVYLPPEGLLKKMARSTQAYIMLSPESHDPIISKLAGRGHYTMEEMEDWIARALEIGIAGVFVWFFIGMPKQTPDSVLATVAYCDSLMKRFPGGRVLPLLCPMVPFLDPGSRVFEDPRPHGYTRFYRTLRDHREAMLEPVWSRRLNYETKWMSRAQIQEITYHAIAQLVRAKGDRGILPALVCARVLSAIEETEELLAEVERAIELDGLVPPSLRRVIGAYNRRVLSYTSDQIVPVERPIGNRWFDDFTVPYSMIHDIVG